MYVCMYVYIYVYTQVCIYIHTQFFWEEVVAVPIHRTSSHASQQVEATKKAAAPLSANPKPEGLPSVRSSPDVYSQGVANKF